MSTTIDSLQIEIQSSSTNAAKGIHDLSTALAGLKANGKITTAVNNLNNLRKALHSFSNIPSNASKILSLAQSLEKLKSVGSVTSIGTGLTKLATSLKTLETVSVDKEKIDKIAYSLSSLSQVKAGGINTMMNGLTKLGKVTKSLDDDTINAFAERIEKLTEKLKPLSDKLTTVQAGLKGINTAARGAGTAIKQTGEDVDGAKVNLSAFIHIIQTAVQWLQQAIQKFSQLMAEAIEWDGIAARFGRGFGSQAQETYAWIQRLNETMGINVQQFMQYSSIYSTMLTGFGVAMEDAGKMALGYTELTYDIWAGYNDVYKNFADAAEAVKSAIAGEVEPIRRAGFTIVEATLKETAANHGLEISLEKATEAQKSYLRYLTLVDQAHAQNLVGTYAKELNTAEGLMRTFAQQTKSLSQAFGSLFLPILVEIMPYLQAFVELLTDIVHRIAALFGITIQGVDWSGYNSGVSDATSGTNDLTGSVGEATDAIKELKNATIGIDELNVISPPSASSSGGGAGGGAGGGSGFDGLDVESLWDESIFANIGSQVDAIKQKLEDWLPVIATVGGVLGALGIGLLLAQLGEGMEKIGQMDGLLGGLKKTLASLAILTIEAVLVFMLSDEYLESGNLMNLVGEALVTAAGGYLMYKGFGTKGLAMSLIVSITAQLAAITFNLADGGVEMDDPELWIQSAFTVAMGAVGGGLVFWKEFGKLDAGKGVVFGALAALSLTLAAITIGDVTANGLSLENAITGVLSALAGGAAGSALVRYLGIASGGTGFLIGTGISLVLTATSVSVSAEDPFGDDLLETIVGAVGMGLGGALIGTAIAPGVGTVIGLMLGVSVSLIISTISAKAKDDAALKAQLDAENEALFQSKLEEEFENRFGSIDLTVSEMDVFVDNVMAIPRNITIDAAGYEMTVSVSAALEFYAVEKDKLEALEADVEKALQELDHLNLKISLGIEVDPETYKAAIDSFLSASQGVLDQHYLTASVALSVLDLDGTAAGGLSGSLTEFYAANSEKLSELGKQLRETVSSAFVDGEWIPEKLNEAMELQAEIQEILKMVSDAEYQAKLTRIGLDLSGADLTQESYDEALAKIEEAVSEQLGNLDEIRLDALTVAILNYEANIDKGMTESEAKKIYNAQVAAIEDAYQKGKIEVSLGEVEVQLDTLQKQFNDELAKFSPDFSKILSFATTIKPQPEETYVFAREMFDDMITQYKKGAEDAVSDEDVAIIEEYLKKLAPSLEDYAEIAREAYTAGKSVPKEIRAGLSDAAELAALTGDLDAIYYLMGEGFASDPKFLTTLSQVKGMGESIPDSMAAGLLANTEFVYDTASGAVIGIKDTINDEFYLMSPALRSNFAAMGVDLSAGLKDGVEKDKPSLLKKLGDWGGGVLSAIKNALPKKDAESIGKDLSDGLGAGVENDKPGLFSRFKTWCGDVVDKVRDFFDTHSPSKVFMDIGKDLSNGLSDGMEQNSLRNKLSSIWSTAKKWWNAKGSLKTYTPSIGSIKDKVVSAWTTAKNWWNKNRSNLSYTPSIGSIKTKLSSAWTTAKNWWNKNRSSLSYTPSIGSIKDKLSSAWNTAKNWWNKNVKLSIPSLNFKVTYSEATGWKKAITTALGLEGWPKLSFAAAGGIFDTGSLVWAGERGPEVLANAGGGKTGVMNVQQMSDAVYEGVYAAVVAAMRATGGSGEGQAVNVYLDGKQIYRSTEQHKKERGASLMGSQVYSY